MLGIAGESGCGKSTLATSLMGFYFPPLHYDSGSIVIDGTDIMSMPYETLRTNYLGHGDRLHSAGGDERAEPDTEGDPSSSWTFSRSTGRTDQGADAEPGQGEIRSSESAGAGAQCLPLRAVRRYEAAHGYRDFDAPEPRFLSRTSPRRWTCPARRSLLAC